MDNRTNSERTLDRSRSALYSFLSEKLSISEAHQAATLISNYIADYTDNLMEGIKKIDGQ